MKILLKCFIGLCILFSCKNTKSKPLTNTDVFEDDLIIAFGSCNRQNSENKLWRPILENKPLAWIWAGDAIYSDTDDMELMAFHYEQQKNQKGYDSLKARVRVFGTWDDHDYGLNDAGTEYVAKAESQQLFLDFLGIKKDDKRRQRQGVYYSDSIVSKKGSVKIIVLDTRYFRTALTESSDAEIRYQPNTYGEGTILGDTQWLWLESELKNSTTDFNLIVSSIQFLSNKHGFETWGNMPHEVEKLNDIIGSSGAKGVLILSGDRHISEFSKTNIEGLSYPLIDFTSSGLTHSYSSFESEPNPYRVGHVVSDISFGLLKVNFETKTVVMQMRGENNKKQQELTQAYE